MEQQRLSAPVSATFIVGKDINAGLTKVARKVAELKQKYGHGPILTVTVAVNLPVYPLLCETNS